MKDMRRLIQLALWNILFVIPLAHAQGVRGRVIDTDRTPIEFATIRVMLPSDTTIVITGGVSDGQGEFSIPLTQASFPLLLKVTSIGYEPRSVRVEGPSPIVISMTQRATMLEETTVTAERPTHTLTAGGIRTRVTGTTLASLPDLMMVLKSLPLVDVKRNEISVVNRGTPIVYVNGRKVQSLDELQRIQPHLVENIEVLTTPDARYDATAESVILITVRREAGSGLSGVLRSDVSRYLASGVEITPFVLSDLNYRVNAWDFIGSVSYARDLGIKGISGDLLGRVDSDSWRNKMTSTSIDKSSGIDATLGANYSGKHTDVGLKYIHQRVLDKEDLIENDLYSSINQDPDKFLYTKNLTAVSPYSVHRVNTYLSQKLGSWQFIADMDYYRSLFKGNKNTYEAYDKRTGGQSYDSRNEVYNRAFGGRLQANGTLWGGHLTVGVEGSYTERKDIYKPAKGLGLPDNDSHIKQNNLSAFTNYSHMLPSIGILSAGLRLECVERRYHRDGKYVEDLSRTFVNLFPNFSFATQLLGINLQASFNSRIERPSYWQLSGEYTYISKFEYQKGDPSLLPSLTYSTELTLNHKWMTLYLSNKHLRRNILQRTERMPDPDKPGEYKPFATLINNYNAEPYNQVQAMLILTPKFGPWSPNWIIGGVMQSGLYFDDFEKKIELNKPTLYLELRNDIALPYEIFLGINGKLMAFGHVMSVKAASPSFTQDLILSKEWLGGSLSTAFTVENFLNITEEDWLITSKHTNFRVKNDYKTRVGISVKYRFNTTKSKYKGKGALDAEIGRMKK